MKVAYGYSTFTPTSTPKYSTIMGKGNVLLGVLSGFAAGAVIGILFAPQKGSDTRRKISQKGREIAEDAKHNFDRLSNRVSQEYENAKDKANQIASNLKSKPGFQNTDTSKQAGKHDTPQ